MFLQKFVWKRNETSEQLFHNIPSRSSVYTNEFMVFRRARSSEFLPNETSEARPTQSSKSLVNQLSVCQITPSTWNLNKLTSFDHFLVHFSKTFHILHLIIQCWFPQMTTTMFRWSTNRRRIFRGTQGPRGEWRAAAERVRYAGQQKFRECGQVLSALRVGLQVEDIEDRRDFAGLSAGERLSFKALLLRKQPFLSTFVHLEILINFQIIICRN